jgi:hypothetical protein
VIPQPALALRDLRLLSSRNFRARRKWLRRPRPRALVGGARDGGSPRQGALVAELGLLQPRWKAILGRRGHVKVKAASWWTTMAVCPSEGPVLCGGG